MGEIDQEFVLKNPDTLASDLMKGLSQVADSRISKIAAMFIWLLIAEAPEAWDEFVDKARYYLNGGIEVNDYTISNDPSRLYICLQRAYNWINKATKVWGQEKSVLYAIFDGFTNADWKCMAAYVEVEVVTNAE